MFEITDREKELFDEYIQIGTPREIRCKIGCLRQYKWERDVAISQLEDLGLSFGQDVTELKELLMSLEDDLK